MNDDELSKFTIADNIIQFRFRRKDLNDNSKRISSPERRINLIQDKLVIGFQAKKQKKKQSIRSNKIKLKNNYISPYIISKNKRKVRSYYHILNNVSNKEEEEEEEEEILQEQQSNIDEIEITTSDTSSSYNSEDDLDLSIKDDNKELHDVLNEVNLILHAPNTFINFNQKKLNIQANMNQLIFYIKDLCNTMNLIKNNDNEQDDIKKIIIYCNRYGESTIMEHLHRFIAIKFSFNNYQHLLNQIIIWHQQSLKKKELNAIAIWSYFQLYQYKLFEHTLGHQNIYITSYQLLKFFQLCNNDLYKTIYCIDYLCSNLYTFIDLYDLNIKMNTYLAQFISIDYQQAIQDELYYKTLYTADNKLVINHIKQLESIDRLPNFYYTHYYKTHHQLTCEYCSTSITYLSDAIYQTLIEHFNIYHIFMDNIPITKSELDHLYHFYPNLSILLAELKQLDYHGYRLKSFDQLLPALTQLQQLTYKKCHILPQVINKFKLLALKRKERFKALRFNQTNNAEKDKQQVAQKEEEEVAEKDKQQLKKKKKKKLLKKINNNNSKKKKKKKSYNNYYLLNYILSTIIPYFYKNNVIIYYFI